MPEQIKLWARWGPKKETVEDCAETIRSFLQRLADCDELFAQGWLKCSRTLQSDVEPLTVSVGELQKVLEKGRSRRDQDKSIIEELGFRSSRLWNGSEESPAHVSIECGSYYVNPRILHAPNNVWVELPNEGPAAARLLRPEKLREIIGVVVENWLPDWAHVSTNKIDAEIYQENPYVGQRIGWLTYISDRYGPLPEMPQEYKLSRLGDVGNLVVVGSITAPLSASHPDHVGAIRQLSNILTKAGMLAPIPPKR